MEYRIGSMNMYKFNYQSNQEISKNYQKIADLIVKERFDILAMQEVLNEGCLQQLKRYLGTNWAYVWAQPISKSTQAAEGYAFLWNINKFRLATGEKKEEQNQPDSEKDWRALKTYNARIYNNYRIDRLIWTGGLVRDPLFARFESVYGWFEIRLINTHIMFSDSSTDSEVSISDAAKRRQELSKLLDIYRQLADRQYRSSRPSYTFLLGDYNLNLNRVWTKSPYLEEAVEITDRNGAVTKRIVTVQDELTTLKQTAPDSTGEDGGYANNYDHFSYDEKRFEGTRLRCKKIDSVETYYGSNFALHRKELSDHVPICMCFSLNE